MDDFLFRAETLLYSHDFTGKVNPPLRTINSPL